MANLTNTKCLIGEARMNWTRVFEPESFNGGEPKYSVVLTFPKTNTKLLNTIEAAIEECRQKAAATMFNGKLPKNFQMPEIKDGDTDYDNEGYPGMWVIKASSKYKPQVVKKMTVAGKASLVEITDESEFYAGCYGYASVTFRAYTLDVNKGISCQLDNLLKTRDGERFGGSGNAATDFASVLDDIDDADDLPEEDIF